MKKIGLIDYYISEWHANNYPGWIKEICEETGAAFEIGYVWAEEFVSPVDGRTTDDWCAEFHAEKCATIAELCEKSDYIMVLAPSDPEKHLGYAREALKCRKNTYIDKTFAPDYATAKEIFAIAQQYGTKFFSSSALRYATELDELVGCDNVITTGSGRLLEEYIIHQIEMAQKIVGEAPTAVKVENQGTQYICSIRYENGRNATLVFSRGLPFAVCAEPNGGKPLYRRIDSPYFKNLLADILRFYESGETSFDPQQTLCVMKAREAVIKAKEDLGSWHTL